MTNHPLTVSNISKYYDTLKIFDNVSLQIKRGEIVALVAPSGSGKSTFLHLLGLLDAPTTGDIFLMGKRTATLNDQEKAFLRASHIGFVYQYHHLLPEFSSLENVILPQLILKKTEKEAKERALFLLDKMGLSHRLGHKPHQLSGGEQQRVAFARALANNPSILLADEPTGNLDLQTGNLVFEELLTIVKETGLSCLIATHNQDLAKKMDRIITIKDQSLVE